jgi:predicted MFS family arabinose efflux permease
MASRVVAAGAAAVFSPTAIAIAASLAPPEKRGKALATVTGGLTIASPSAYPWGP